MANRTEKKGIVRKIVDDLVESTKEQHKITMAQMELNKVSVPQATAMFKERHADAKNSPVKKQAEQLAEIEEKIAEKNARYGK